MGPGRAWNAEGWQAQKLLGGWVGPAGGHEYPEGPELGPEAPLPLAHDKLSRDYSTSLCVIGQKSWGRPAPRSVPCQGRVKSARSNKLKTVNERQGSSTYLTRYNGIVADISRDLSSGPRRHRQFSLSHARVGPSHVSPVIAAGKRFMQARAGCIKTS